MPGIKLTRRVTGEEARTLQSCFSKGVIEIDIENGKKFMKSREKQFWIRLSFQTKHLMNPRFPHR